MYVVIFITASSKEEARKIAGKLVESKLAACVNIIENIHSVFWWAAKLDACDEVLLIVKSIRRNFSRISKLVKSLHSYEVPEIIALPIIAGEKNYLKWIDESVK